MSNVAVVFAGGDLLRQHSAMPSWVRVSKTHRIVEPFEPPVPSAFSKVPDACHAKRIA
jgi:hypothetical protein